jgi:hypothetical protein
MAAATSSLPVPLSPSMSTAESLAATLLMMAFTRSIGAEFPISSLTVSSSPSRARSECTSPRRKRRSTRRVMRWRSSSRMSGFDR